MITIIITSKYEINSSNSLAKGQPDSIELSRGTPVLSRSVPAFFFLAFLVGLLAAPTRGSSSLHDKSCGRTSSFSYLSPGREQ